MSLLTHIISHRALIPEAIISNIKQFHPLSSVVYFETYGCQMNVSDTEIAWSVLKNAGYQKTEHVKEVC